MLWYPRYSSIHIAKNVKSVFECGFERERERDSVLDCISDRNVVSWNEIVVAIIYQRTSLNRTSP